MRASLLGKEMIVPSAIRPQDLSRYSLIRLFNAMIGFGEIEFPVANIR
jgi:4-amino-4-deoxychorismate lyase